MNKWKSVWAKRTDFVEQSEDVFDMFCKLKRADGFDVQVSESYYEKMLAQWDAMNELIGEGSRCPVRSVYEVGCGSGVNLFLYQKMKQIENLGGIDYCIKGLKKRTIQKKILYDLRKKNNAGINL